MLKSKLGRVNLMTPLVVAFISCVPAPTNSNVRAYQANASRTPQDTSGHQTSMTNQLPDTDGKNQISILGVVNETGAQLNGLKLNDDFVEITTLQIINGTANFEKVEVTHLNKNSQFTTNIHGQQFTLISYSNDRVGQRTLIIPPLDAARDASAVVILNDLTTLATKLFEVLVSQDQTVQLIEKKTFNLLNVYKAAFTLKKLESDFGSQVITDSVIRKTIELLLKNNKDLVNKLAQDPKKLKALQEAIYQENLSIFNFFDIESAPKKLQSKMLFANEIIAKSWEQENKTTIVTNAGLLVQQESKVTDLLTPIIVDSADQISQRAEAAAAVVTNTSVVEQVPSAQENSTQISVEPMISEPSLLTNDLMVPEQKPLSELALVDTAELAPQATSLAATSSTSAPLEAVVIESLTSNETAPSSSTDQTYTAESTQVAPQTSTSSIDSSGNVAVQSGEMAEQLQPTIVSISDTFPDAPTQITAESPSAESSSDTVVEEKSIPASDVKSEPVTTSIASTVIVDSVDQNVTPLPSATLSVVEENEKPDDKLTDKNVNSEEKTEEKADISSNVTIQAIEAKLNNSDLELNPYFERSLSSKLSNERFNDVSFDGGYYVFSKNTSLISYDFDLKDSKDAPEYLISIKMALNKASDGVQHLLSFIESTNARTKEENRELIGLKFENSKLLIQGLVQRTEKGKLTEVNKVDVERKLQVTPGQEFELLISVGSKGLCVFLNGKPLGSIENKFLLKKPYVKMGILIGNDATAKRPLQGHISQFKLRVD